MNSEKQATLLALTAVILWSTVATAFKLTLKEFTPIQMLFFASLTTVIFLTGLCLWKGELNNLYPSFIRQPVFFLIAGLINPFFYYLILFKAYELLPASQAQPINYSWAITLTLMASFFLKQKIRLQDWVACLLGYLGVLIIATQGKPLSLEFHSDIGVLLALLSTILWAGYWILNTKNNASPLISVLLCFSLSLPFSAGLVWYEGFQWQEITLAGWGSVIYVGLFEMGVTFVIWLTALKKTHNTSRLSNLIFLSPFISLLLLSQIIGEEIGSATILGLLLILCGLAIQQIKTKNSPKEQGIS